VSSSPTATNQVSASARAHQKRLRSPQSRIQICRGDQAAVQLAGQGSDSPRTNGDFSFQWKSAPSRVFVGQKNYPAEEGGVTSALGRQRRRSGLNALCEKGQESSSAPSVSGSWSTLGSAAGPAPVEIDPVDSSFEAAGGGSSGLFAVGTRAAGSFAGGVSSTPAGVAG
jgi:hypothetical protein